MLQLAGNKYIQFSMGNRGSQPDIEDDASQRPLVVPESDESQKRREYFAACADDRARQAQVQTSTLAAAKPASCSCQLQIIITHNNYPSPIHGVLEYHAMLSPRTCVRAADDRCRCRCLLQERAEREATAPDGVLVSVSLPVVSPQAQSSTLSD